MGVSVAQYAIHQGGIALAYGVVSLFLHKIIRIFGQQSVEIASVVLLVLAITGIISGYILNLHTPIYVTILILLGSIGSIYLTNRAQIMAVTYRAEWEGKVSALIMLGRWLLTALLLQVSGALYHINESLALTVVAFAWAAEIIVLWNNLKPNNSVS